MIEIGPNLTNMIEYVAGAIVACVFFWGMFRD
jgi:hypothetical protein